LAAGDNLFTRIIGFIAVVFGAMNVVGGFWVTHRMLGMFKPDWARKKKG
jgi:proton-translocating NAD(P)+ transhydrogenase subunit alpha